MSSRLLERHRRVAIDSNVLIYLFEGTGERAEVAGRLLDAIAAGEGEGVLSTVALAELCSGPARIGDGAMVERYADELASLENVRLVPVDRGIAVEAALLRGGGGMSLLDAIHLATASAAGATALATNDRALRSTGKVEVVYLDELSPG